MLERSKYYLQQACALGSKGPVGSVGRHGTGELESGDLMQGSGDLM